VIGRKEQGALFAACFLLATYSAHASTLKTETWRSYDTLMKFCPLTEGYIPQDNTFHGHDFENLVSNIDVKR
jgi:hypothetical protein